MNPNPIRRLSRRLSSTSAALFASLAVAGVFDAAHSRASERGDSTPLHEARQILDDAFANRYEIDLTSTIELTVRGKSGSARHRVVHAVSKLIDDRVHSIGRIESPHFLRGMTILTIEAENRGHDAFMYLPSLDRVRRISTAQRGDTFFGTDVTYEDIERRRIEEYVLASAARDIFENEAVFVIHGRPVKPGNYERVRFSIAETDRAILVIDYYKRGSEDPYRTIVAPRSGMVHAAGHILPTVLKVWNHDQHSTTDVTVSDIDTDVEIDDRIFSVRTLESMGALPGE